MTKLSWVLHSGGNLVPHQFSSWRLRGYHQEVQDQRNSLSQSMQCQKFGQKC